MRHDEPNFVKPALTGLSATLVDIARSSLVGPMNHAEALAFAATRSPVEEACDAMAAAAAARVRSQERRIAELERALSRIANQSAQDYEDPEQEAYASREIAAKALGALT